MKKILGVLMTVACAGAWGGATASAAPEEEAQAVLLLDASDSMTAEDVGGGTRMDAAKRAAQELVDSLPATARLGLMAYGMEESNAPDNHAAGCQDVSVLSPVNTVDKNDLKQKIDGMQPKGYTPIGTSLRQAAEEMTGQGQKSIILVSDGIDTCAPPPVCEVAEELAGEGVDLAIHTVGFRVDDAAREELSCIAAAGNGEFVEANDAGELSEKLQFLSTRAITDYQSEGTEFEYADTVEGAQWLGEGLYHTRTPVMPDGSAPKYFRVAVPEDHNAWVSVSALPQRNEQGEIEGSEATGVNILVEEAYVPSNEVQCAANKYSDNTFGQTKSDSLYPPSTSVTYIDGQMADKDCDMSQWVIGHALETYSDGGLEGQEIDVEVSIHFEPIPHGEGGPEASDRISDEPRVDFGEATDISGGSGFSNAAAIDPGTYRDRIVPGEYKFYKVPVEWGQRPQIAVRYTSNADRNLNSLGYRIYSPVLVPVEKDFSNVFGEDVIEEAIASSHYTSYANREQPQVKHSAVAGEYVIGVSMENGRDHAEFQGLDQEFELAVAVDGEAVDGPEWRPTMQPGPAPSDGPPAEEPAEQEPAEQAEAAAEPEEDSGIGKYLMIGIAGVVLLAVIVGAVLLVRGRGAGR